MGRMRSGLAEKPGHLIDNLLSLAPPSPHGGIVKGKV